MKAWGIRLVTALALLVPVFSSGAIDRGTLIEKAEMSMLVSGGIDMRPDGSVERYSIDHSGKLSQAVMQMIGAQVSQWRFEPTLVDGKPASAHTNMSLRIVAKPIDEQNFNVRIQSASFSGGSEDAAERLSVQRKTPIGPMVRALMATGINGANLYLALKIGRDGKVLDAVVEQVNLGALGSEKYMADTRKVLGDSALSVVRQWTFSVPSSGPSKDEPYWSGILPIVFSVSAGSAPADVYGRWRAYIPGPCVEIPWRVLEAGVGKSRCGADSAPDGAFTLDDSGPKLLTPLMQG